MIHKKTLRYSVYNEKVHNTVGIANNSQRNNVKGDYIIMTIGFLKEPNIEIFIYKRYKRPDYLRSQ